MITRIAVILPIITVMITPIAAILPIITVTITRIAAILQIVTVMIPPIAAILQIITVMIQTRSRYGLQACARRATALAHGACLIDKALRVRDSSGKTGKSVASEDL
jgi:hypothetical protein